MQTQTKWVAGAVVCVILFATLLVLFFTHLDSHERGGSEGFFVVWGLWLFAALGVMCGINGYKENKKQTPPTPPPTD